MGGRYESNFDGNSGGRARYRTPLADNTGLFALPPKAEQQSKRHAPHQALAKPFSAFEDVAMSLLLGAAAVSIGIGFLAMLEPGKSTAGRRDAAAPTVAVSAHNPGRVL